MVVTDWTYANKLFGVFAPHIVPSVQCIFVVHSEAVLIPSFSIVWLLIGLSCPLGDRRLYSYLLVGETTC